MNNASSTQQTPGSIGGQPGGISLPPPQFFVDHKKGEVNELKQLLKAVSIDKDQTKKRDVIKKVIAYMTLGIDVSRLYPEMVKASRTDDVVMKKMIYLYLINYAEQNQELAILAINTFLMDCNQTMNHKIRGLALRSLCSLRFEGVSNYMQQAIQSGLNDIDPYVKKTAIIGCVKFFHLTKSEFKKTDFLETLYKLTRDHDALVVINAIEAINEILADKGGIEVTRQLIIHLLNRIKDFNEWGQSIILELTTKYQPATQEEKFDIMNLLEDRFKHASSSVVLGAVKVFLYLTKDDENLSRQVFERLQAPLITLMTSSETTESYEVSFNVLSHIHLLVLKGANTVFESEYKHFFVKYDEPSYIKNLKLEILAQIASANNIQEIVNELSEYVTDVNAEIAKKSIRCFGTIIIRLQKMSKTVSAQLRNFLSLRISYVTTETVIVLKDVLRKYRNFIDDFIPFFSKISLDQIIEVDGKAAYVWILGEFGELIDDSPYILEKMIEEQREFNSVKLSGVLLTALFKLFFKRAPEVHKMLGLFLEFTIKNQVDTDLKQRAVFYYRLLQTDLEAAQRIVTGEQEKIDEFYEDKNEELKEKLFLEFNSLSVVYQKPAERYIKDPTVIKQLQAAERRMQKKEKTEKAKDDKKDSDDDEDDVEEKKQELPAALDFDLIDISGPQSAHSVNQPQNILGDFDLQGPSTTLNKPQDAPYVASDLLGVGSSQVIGNQQQRQTQYGLEELGGFGGVVQPQTVDLSETPDLDSEKFQTLWMQLADAPPLQAQMRADIIFNTTEIEQVLGQHKIFCMASGQIGNELKFFFFAQSADRNGYFLIETMINQQSKLMTANLKTTRSDLAQAFLNMFTKGFVHGVELRHKEKDEKMMKERLEMEREKVLEAEIEKYEQEKFFKIGKKAIKKSGILDAYDKLVDDFIVNGFPKMKLNGDIFEYAAYFIDKYDRNKKTKQYVELNKRLQERERHRVRSMMTGEDDEISMKSEHRNRKKKTNRSETPEERGRSKTGKKNVKGKGGDRDSIDSMNDRGRSKSKKGGKEDPKDKGKNGKKGGKDKDEDSLGRGKSKGKQKGKEEAKSKSKGGKEEAKNTKGGKDDGKSARSKSKAKIEEPSKNKNDGKSTRSKSKLDEPQKGGKDDGKTARSKSKVKIEEPLKSAKGGGKAIEKTGSKKELLKEEPNLRSKSKGKDDDLKSARNKSKVEEKKEPPKSTRNKEETSRGKSIEKSKVEEKGKANSKKPVKEELKVPSKRK